MGGIKPVGGNSSGSFGPDKGVNRSDASKTGRTSGYRAVKNMTKGASRLMSNSVQVAPAPSTKLSEIKFEASKNPKGAAASKANDIGKLIVPKPTK